MTPEILAIFGSAALNFLLVGVAWGTLTQRVKAVEKAIEGASSPFQIGILTQKVDTLQQDVTRMKDLLAELLSRRSPNELVRRG